MKPTMSPPLLPDEIDRVRPSAGHDLISATAHYLNRRQIERHQELLGRTGNRLEALTEIAAKRKP
jgi:hypothetical protein